MRYSLVLLALLGLSACSGMSTPTTTANDPSISAGQRMFCANRERLGEHFYRECLYGQRHGQN
jgi:hypothetical protein